MPLPIMIFLERHWDVEPKKALMGALPFLYASGYDTLCFESPCEKNEQETITAIESTVKFIEERLAEANQYLARHGISVDLPSMDYNKLQDLLHNYVSTRYYKEMALWFKELPGHKEKLNMVKMAVGKNIKICGIDLTSAQLEPINSAEAQNSLSTRVQRINELDEIRTLAFKKNMLELQQEGKGVIFVVGQSHYQPLVEAFAKEYLLKEIIFLHPYALKCLDSSYIDYNLPSFSHIEDHTIIEQIIHNNNDIEIFSTNLKATAQPMLDNSVSIEPTGTCRLLKIKTKLNFESYFRPSYIVDCYHFFENREDITDTVNKLNKKGVKGFFTFFKNKESYCVPCINTQEVASQIQKIDL